MDKINSTETDESIEEVGSDNNIILWLQRNWDVNIVVPGNKERNQFYNHIKFLGKENSQKVKDWLGKYS